MAMNDIYLKASLFLLCLELFHFLHQRKLNDKRSVIFFSMIINTMMICIFSIILTNLLDHKMANCISAKVSYTIVYLTQLLFPYILFCMINLTIRPGFTHFMKICAIPVGIASFIVLTNPFSGFISIPQSDGLLHVSGGYPLLVYFIMVYYLFDLVYLISHFKVLKLRQITALGEVSLFLLIGMFAQNIFHIRLFIGFAATLSVVAIHLTLHNPYAYIDFGSSYANLNTILRLPFSVIKIDRSLLFKISKDHNAAAFYQGMVHTLKNIGYKIVSEGIETQEEALLVKEWGVDMIQGYYYSKPEPCEKLINLLERKES